VNQSSNLNLFWTAKLWGRAYVLALIPYNKSMAVLENVTKWGYSASLCKSSVVWDNYQNERQPCPKKKMTCCCLYSTIRRCCLPEGQIVELWNFAYVHVFLCYQKKMIFNHIRAPFPNHSNSLQKPLIRIVWNKILILCTYHFI